MKKNLIIISLIFSMFATYAQEVKNENKNPKTVTSQTAPASDKSGKDTTKAAVCHHRINVHLGGAMTNNIYNRMPNVKQNYSLGSILEIQYAYFFNQHWGLGLGIGLQKTSAKASFNFAGTVANWADPNFGGPEGYDLNYHANGLVENQSIYAIEIPLQAQFEHKFNGKAGIYAALGVKGYFPIAAGNKYKGDGEIVTSGYEAYTDALYQNMPNHFGTYQYTGKSEKSKMKCSIDLQADFGGLFTMGPKVDFYVGAYCSYGFLDILPKQKTDFITYENNQEVLFNGTLGTDFEKMKIDKTKWHLLQVGLKVGVHLKPCSSLNQKSMQELKRQYMEEMMKKSNEPIIIKNTEYVYIVPVCDDLTNADTIASKKALSKQDQNQLRQLAEALSNTKILFDLDKDVPKVSDKDDNIAKTVQIMKNNPSFELVVEGYTCDLGSENHNRELAQRRADK
ncbi:MAG: hypothetical protein RR356_06125, partial [Bacteroidales bacterium]